MRIQMLTLGHLHSSGGRRDQRAQNIPKMTQNNFPRRKSQKFKMRRKEEIPVATSRNVQGKILLQFVTGRARVSSALRLSPGVRRRWASE